MIEHGHPPIAVYTQPDRPSGRGRKLAPSPVKVRGIELGCPIEQPMTLKDKDAQAQLAAYKPDLMVVVAYGLILPRAVLETPTYGCINVHASILPRWRGAAPIERAYMAGDQTTGVCIMQMDEGLDTGPVFEQASLEIGDKPIGQVEQELSTLGVETLLKTIEAINYARSNQSEIPVPIPQLEAGASYAHKLTAEDRHIDFTLPVATVVRHINALAERMPARMTIDDKRVQLLDAAVSNGSRDTIETAKPGEITRLDKSGLHIQCATGSLLIRKLKFEGGKGTTLDGAAMLNGYAGVLTLGAIVH